MKNPKEMKRMLVNGQMSMAKYNKKMDKMVRKSGYANFMMNPAVESSRQRLDVAVFQREEKYKEEEINAFADLFVKDIFDEAIHAYSIQPQSQTIKDTKPSSSSQPRRRSRPTGDPTKHPNMMRETQAFMDTLPKSGGMSSVEHYANVAELGSRPARS
jgi:hypothetical protein